MNSDFRFEQPWFLLLLLVLPTVWLYHRRFHRPAGVSFAPVRNLEVAAALRSPHLWFQTALIGMGCCILILALARPQAGEETSSVHASGIDIMLLLDVSRSMLSEDFQIGSERASRIDVVKQVTERFIQGRPSDRIGIIAFAGRPYMVSPLTLDHDWLLANLKRLQIGLTEDGTAIGSALVAGANRLRDPNVKSRVIVLLTDGDNNAGKVPPLTAAEAAAAIGIKIYTIGTGTNGLVPFPTTDQFGNKFYTQEYMPFQEDACRQIARIGSGKFYRATDTRGLSDIFTDIDHLEKHEIAVQEYRTYRDLFAWFAGLGAVLVAGGSACGETLWRQIP
ncbi:MAG: VWA domain-containing protein [Verrucomicrobia bacterium]|nr:VWA domain-containing protein [Verrucomicrobiota bacterium]